MTSGDFIHGDKRLFEPLVRSLLDRDDYMLFADYQSYIDAQGPGCRSLQEPGAVNTHVDLNVTRSGKFSSDRSIRDYCADMWKTWPVKIQL